MTITLEAIGYIKSPYTSRGHCPHQPDSNSPPVELVLEKKYVEATKRLYKGDLLIILTWLHLSNRDVLLCHPRGDKNRPVHGVFATRSPDRPNPIGHHVVKLIEIKDNIMLIHPMEVVNGTPVIDIKPFRREDTLLDLELLEEWRLIKDIGFRSWQKGLLSGFSGNISLRKKNGMIITRSGIAKGYLQYEDIAFASFDEDFKSKGLSSESFLHAEIYKNQPHARAILHTHPPYLLALSMLVQEEQLLDIPLYEAQMYKSMFVQIPSLPPGSRELALEVGKKASSHNIIFLRNHGLVCWGKDLINTLALSEEIENIARIQYLAVMQNKGGCL